MISTENEDENLKKHYLLRHFPTLLKRWKGKPFRLYGLTTSHRSIHIMISNNIYNYKEPHLLLDCVEPISMKGNFDHETNDLEVKTLDDEYYVVYDKISGFELVCEKVEISEHLHPKHS